MTALYGRYTMRGMHSTTTPEARMLTLDTPLTALATDEEMSAIATSIYDNLDSIGDDLIDSSVVGEDWGDALDRVLRADESATISDLRVELLTSR